MMRVQRPKRYLSLTTLTVLQLLTRWHTTCGGKRVESKIPGEADTHGKRVSGLRDSDALGELL